MHMPQAKKRSGIYPLLRFAAQAVT